MSHSSDPKGDPVEVDGSRGAEPIQRRTVALLSAAQMFTSVGTAAVVTVGPMLAAELAGDSLAGTPSTAQSLGATIAAALLARFAISRGRRPALSTGITIALSGALLVILAAVTEQFWLVVVGSGLAGFGGASNLQARFAATDLAKPAHRGRDLSLVVWLGTIGVVAGPNLVGVGESVATWLGLPVLSGIFVLSAASLLVALILVFAGLRPDPLLLARERAGIAGASMHRPGLITGLRSIGRHPRALAGLIGVAAGHGLMVAVMGMTPVHMTHHGATIVIVGIVVSLHMFAMYGVSPVWGLLADRVGGVAVVVLGLVTTLASGVIAAFAGGDHVVTAVGLILLGLGWGASTVAGAVLVVNGVPAEERVGAQGASDTIMNLAGAVLGLASGWVLSAVGYEGLGISAAALAAIAAAAVILLTARSRARG